MRACAVLLYGAVLLCTVATACTPSSSAQNKARIAQLEQEVAASKVGTPEGVPPTPTIADQTSTPTPTTTAKTPTPTPQLAVASLPRFNPGTYGCDGFDYSKPTVPGTWQVSAPRGIPGPVRPSEVIQIGLRSKFGNDAVYVSARVIRPDGSSTTKATGVLDSNWAYLTFPTDFAGAVALTPGTYTILWESNGGPIACDGFVVVR